MIGRLISVLLVLVVMASWFSRFRVIRAVDLEFHQPPGEAPGSLCISWLDLNKGQGPQHVWLDGESYPEPPFSIDDDILFLAFTASAEITCFRTLGWTVPKNWCDLFVEERVATNGKIFDPDHRGRGLLAVLDRYGLSHNVTPAKKVEMRALAIRGGPFTLAEMIALMDYCDTDVIALQKLMSVMAGSIDIDRALHRGSVMARFAEIELRGIKVDTDTLAVFRERWGDVKNQTAMLAAARFAGVYQGRRFDQSIWKRYLSGRGLADESSPTAWPRLASGKLKLDDGTFRDMSRVYPRVRFLRDARKIMQLLNVGITVGRDGRNRCMSSPFATKTGRCSPSTSKSILCAGKWMRPLIMPAEGMAMANVDLKGADYGAMAALSGDSAMQHAYRSGDPYLRFAIDAKAAPEGATKRSHRAVREIYKTVTLATSYGLTARGLAVRLGIQSAEAAALLELHRRLYKRFWKWNDAISCGAQLRRKIETRLLWPLHVTAWSAGDRSLRNWPVQSTVAEILHVSLLLAHERGLAICGTAHDAVFLEAPLAEIDEAVLKMREVMSEASSILLGGFALDTDATIVRYPDRFPTTPTWHEVLKMVGLE